MYDTAVTQSSLVDTGPDENQDGSPAYALAGVIIAFLAIKYLLESTTNIQFAEERWSIVSLLSTTVKAIIGIMLFKTGVASLEGNGLNTGGLKTIAAAL